MRITEVQIQKLYQFTREHYVQHYDVQTELVDHLANDIEEIWRENPNLTFEQAKQKSFQKFGVFGFMEVVEQRQKQMTKRYWKILWRFVKEWFTLPKVIMTAFIFLVFYKLLQYEVSLYIFGICMLILFAFEMTCLLIIKHKVRLKKKKKERVFMLEEMIHSTRNGFSILMLINVYNIVNLADIDFSSLANYWIALVAFVLTLIAIIFYVAEFVLPSKAEELLEENFPEYKLMKKM